MNEMAIMPVSTMADLRLAGELMAKSGMFGAKNEAEGFVIATTCQQQGMSLMDFIRTYHLVDNKPSMRADAMAAEFRKAGGKYKVVERSSKKAAALFVFEGQEIEFSFTIEEAEAKGITKSASGTKTNWKKFPENMLWARMISNAVRVLAPEIVAGCYTPEEVQDFDQANPAPAAQTKEVDPVEAAERVQATVVNVQPAPASQPQPATPPPATTPATPPPANDVDCAVCPIPGLPLTGVAWDTMNVATLKQALQAKHEKMTPGHYEFIKQTIAKKEQSQ